MRRRNNIFGYFPVIIFTLIFSKKFSFFTNHYMKTITVTGLRQLINNKEDFQLIDTREPYEHATFNIGGVLMPLGDITKLIEQIEKQKPVVLYCRVGVRSQIAIQRLQEKYPFTNLINLIGGTEAWKKESGNTK